MWKIVCQFLVESVPRPTSSDRFSFIAGHLNISIVKNERKFPSDLRDANSSHAEKKCLIAIFSFSVGVKAESRWARGGK